jgi:tRNA pseudouridine55 synthase
VSAPRARPPSGVLVVDKPRGPTSHDVVARVRRALGTREVGHAGTLDPMATGVLVVAVGEATKLVQWLTAHDKAYRATVRLGATTRSFDAEGEIVETRPIDDALRATLAAASRGEIDDALARALDVERARTEQTPPAVSAIKVDGVASHKRVRQGDEVELPPRPVAVRSLQVLAARVDPPELDVELEVAKGYYVRAFARDLAASLGTVAHLVALRRLASGPFRIEEAVALEPAALAAGRVALSVAVARVLPSATLTDDGVVRARQGKRLCEGDFSVAPPAASGGVSASAWLDPAGEVVAIGELDGDAFRVVRGFVPAHEA